jgi:GR25 family glycosyltransferase involved in LPS biosynthesis
MLPPVYWINLDRSRRRRERMEAALSARGVGAVRVPAIDGADRRAVHTVLRSRAPTPVVAACLASHLLAIQSAFRAGHEAALFLEDDASFELFDRRPRDLTRVVQQMAGAWSALWVGYGDTPRRLDVIFREERDVIPIPLPTLWSTVAYVLHRRAMAHLLERYDRGDHFDVTSFDEAHEADTLLLRTLHAAPGLLRPQVLRVPLFVFEGRDSEIHEEDLPRQNAAREFVLASHDALLAGAYRSPFLVSRFSTALRRIRRGA